MSRIGVILGQDFEDSEYIQPVEAMKKEGHEIIHLGLKQGETVKGKKEGTEVKIDQSLDNVSAGDFDAMLIPGGYSPDNLRAHEEPVRFTREFFETGKTVFCICHGAQLLISADTLRGRTLTGWKSITKDIENAGGNFVDEELVIDDNLVTSRNPDDLPVFCKACIERL